MSHTGHTADLVVIGGGLGGVSATIAAARLGLCVILATDGGWLGGQLTSQAVPPDEYPWIEDVPPSASYAELRTRIRQHYRSDYPLSAAARASSALNPGRGRVSKLCHEPRIAALVMEEMLSPFIASGRVRVLRHRRPVAVERDGREVRAVEVEDVRDGERRMLRGHFIIDATELGDLLPLAEIDHVIGTESRAETGELHAPDTADPLDQQAVTWCAALEFRPGEEHVIERPARYDEWKSKVADFWPGPQLSWRILNVRTLEPYTAPLFPSESDPPGVEDMWTFRRVLARETFDDDWPGNEVTIMNWASHDYWDTPLVGYDGALQEGWAGSRSLALSLIHWLQTEAPRADGGLGYPELTPRGDLVGTDDGLAREPYIRESRRIRALFTVTEGHIGEDMRGTGAGSEIFDDSVGIGCYRIDLHPSTGQRTYIDVGCFPFQIPLGALIPAGGGNLLPANKNIGTTHITNGAYRLHPVEWSIGEAVGALAAFCRREGGEPVDVWSDPRRRADYQSLLTDRLGVRLAWPDEIRTQAV